MSPTQMKQAKSFEFFLHRYLYNFYNVANKQQKIKEKKKEYVYITYTYQVLNKQKKKKIQKRDR
jgi:hypothetical protein